MNDGHSAAIQGPILGVSKPVAGIVTHTEPSEGLDDDIVMEEAKMSSFVAAGTSNSRSNQVEVNV